MIQGPSDVVSRIASREPAVVRLTATLSRSDLLWLANTAHGAGGHWHARVHGGEPEHDHLAEPESAGRYLADHGVHVPDVLPDPAALAELRIVREMVERLIEPGADPWTAEGRALLESADFAVTADGQVASSRTGWAGFSRELILPLLDLVRDDARLRRCANPSCHLLFEDVSRNHARRWCDTAGCGNRDRVRRARGRHAPPPSA